MENNNEGYIIKVMRNDNGRSGRGFNSKPLFEFRGGLARFNIKNFEKRLRAIEREHGLLSLSFAALLWGMVVRLTLAL